MEDTQAMKNLRNSGDQLMGPPYPLRATNLPVHSAKHSAKPDAVYDRLY